MNRERLRVSAPGKVIVAGEYAVLAGAPAISMAINRRALVDIQDVDADYHVVETPGLASGRWQFSVGESAISWEDSPPDGVKSIVSALRACIEVVEPNRLHITIDTSAFFDSATGRKLGLGSSAAAVVALVSGLSAYREDRSAIDELAYRVHLDLQRGRGSGIDVATSLAGGLIEYRRGDDAAPLQRDWPSELRYAFFWSGQPADTVAKIRTLVDDDFSAGPGAALVTSAEAIASVWSAGDDPLPAIKAYCERLNDFSDEYGLGIFDAGHDQMASFAAELGVLYKPCGAGGGDVGIAISYEEEAIRQLQSTASAKGFVPLSLTFDSRGIVVEK